MSKRRATGLLSVDRSTMRYQSKRPSDAQERSLLKELAAERRRFGYRRLREMARRRGVIMNLKKVYRLYKGLPPVSTALLLGPGSLKLRADPRQRGVWMCPQKRRWTRSARSGGATSAGRRR